MRRADDLAGSFATPPAVEEHIAASRGRGDALPDRTGEAIGQALGADLRDVRVHADAASAASATAIGATAYTTGNDIFFGAGQYQPESQDGQRLLAHELTHVVQQGAAPVQPIRRHRSKERQQNEQHRVWAERMQGAPLNLAAADAQTLATGLAGRGPSIVTVEELARLIARGWTAASVVTLVRKFHADPGGLSAAQWRMVAEAPAAVNQPDVVGRFARAGNGWTAGSLAALIGSFVANSGGLTAAQWVALAAIEPVVNQVADVEAFARLAGWTQPQKLALLQAFGADAGGLNRTQFLAIATAHANVANQAAHVATFARVTGWNAAGKQTLATAWGTDAGTITPTDWRAIAEAHAVLANDSVAVAGFARMANWTAVNKANVAGLFGANAGGRTAAQWAAIAVGHAGLADHEADVAEFARIANGWTAANLATLAALYGADAGGRTTADWVQLAGAHAGLADQEQLVAHLARANWPSLDATNFFTQGVAAGLAAPGLVAVLTIAGAPAAGRAMIVTGWTAAHLGTFVGTARQQGLDAATTAGFLATPGMPAATVAMRASWSATQLANFTAAAIQAGATAAGLRPMFALGTFPARSFALIAGAWTDAHVGQFCGAAQAQGLRPDRLLPLIATLNVPAALRTMTTAGWTHDDLGTFAAAARLAGVVDARLLALMQNGNFRAGTVLMRAGPWTPEQLGHFTAGINATNLPVAQIGTLTNTANFAANGHAWIGAGFTARQVGQICGRARLANGGNFQPVALTAFLGTANAATHARALYGRWTIDDIGATVGLCRTQAGAPTDAQMVQLLERAAVQINGNDIQALWIRRAAQGVTCGAPNWAQLITHSATFQTHWQGGPVGRANQPSVVKPGTRGGPPYQVEIRLLGERIDHVEQGHTFEYHLFTYANCTRAGVGVGGHASFVAVGLNMTTELQNLQADGTVGNIAENAAWGVAPTQSNALGYRFGVLRDGGAYGPPPRTYPTRISQAYPTAGTNIVGRDLVGMGRFFGQIP